MEQKITTSLQQRWLSKLLGYDYVVTNKKGKDNRADDALSRVFENEEECDALISVTPSWKEEISKSLINDQKAQYLIAKFSINGMLDDEEDKDYQLVNGELKFKGKYYIGKGNLLREKICSNIHGSMERGHSGIAASIKQAELSFYLPTLKADMKKFVKECETCQQNKSEHVLKPGLLQLIPLPNHAWEGVSMDFVEGLPRSRGKDVILVVVDKLTKYCHLITLTHPFSAAKVAQEFLNQVVKLYGVPVDIITDRDPIFISSFWQELFKVLGTKIKMSTAYHPQTDGQTERINQCIEMYLRCMTGQKPADWAEWIPMAEWWYNTLFPSLAGMTPYQALYGQTPP